MSLEIRAVLLDFDGTLVDSEPLHYEAWLAAVKPHGGYVDWPDYQVRFVGKTDHWAAETFLGEAGLNPPPELLAEVKQAKHAYFRKHSPERLAIDEETIASVVQLAENLLVGVVSSSIARDVEPTLRKHGLTDRFEFLVCGEHVSRHKPDPEPYLLAHERLRARDAAIEADHCLVFEDSDSGVAAATAAGMKVRRVGTPEQLPGMLRDLL